ncbi:MAG: hypothetical protein HQL60_08305, partial [Magnetococcales bacterium]|nr:hypothetical protein [Magnetococcales bacterium]
MRYDTTLKDLFKQPPQRLLQLLVGQRAVEVLTGIEFPSTQKRVPDLVFHLLDQSIFHLELQGASELIQWRMLMYRVFIRYRYPGQRLIQKVLYIGNKRWQPETAIVEEGLQFSYGFVDIRDIDCHEMLDSPMLEENILAVLCRMGDTQETIREILRRINRLPPKARKDSLEKLVVISGLRKLEAMVQKEADEMAVTIDLMENDVIRPLLLKGIQDGKMAGIKEGIK